MKFKKIITLTALFLSTAMFFGCAKKDEFNPNFKNEGQKIYLYGEMHSNKMHLEEELKLIEKHYNEGVRDLFTENSIAGAEYLNMWMKEKDNKILDELMKDIEGTAAGTALTRKFYIKIKEKFPEIVFHGTDVSHQYFSTGSRYLEYLKADGGSKEKIKLVEENNEQGKVFSTKKREEERDFWKYREEKMIENFKKAYERLGNKSIIGIYGGAHIDISEGNVWRNETDNILMAEKLKKVYGENLVLRDLTKELGNKKQDIKPKEEILKINGKDYKTKYFGKENNNYKDAELEVWILENALDDFKEFKEIGKGEFDGIPVFAMGNCIFRVKFTYKDGREKVQFYRTKNENVGGKFKGYLIKEEQ